MKNRQFGVFGLGEFGRGVALALAENGCEVLAVDKDEARIERIADDVTLAVTADVCDSETMNSLGIHNLDGAVIAISDNLEAAIMATINLKEAEVPYIIAKVKDRVQQLVLEKMGVDKVIFPEKAMGYRIGRSLSTGRFLDYIELSDRFSIVELVTPKRWVGKSLRTLNLRDRYGLNVIGRKMGEDFEMNLNPDDPLIEGACYVVIGDNAALDEIREEE